jgi:hypothetical protein
VPTQPPIKWVTGALSDVDLYLHSLIRLHGVVLNELSTGAICILEVHISCSSGINVTAQKLFYYYDFGADTAQSV